MSADIIQARYDDLAAIAARFGEQAEQSAALQRRVSQCADTLTQEGWEGAGVLAFRAEMDDEVFPALQRLIQALEEGRAVTLEASTIMQQAEEEAAALFQGGGMASVGAAARTAAEAMAGAIAEIYDRETDRRVDLRIEADERWGRSAGGDRGGSHFDYDWAGGAILERYLTGGDDWHIDNDPRWTEYMQAHPSLTNELQGHALDTAQELHQSGKKQIHIDESFHTSLESGEGVVGYQYLDGTNANVGGFERKGVATIAPDGQGGHTVTMNMEYTWNDIIDPNPQYDTDTWKSRFAELITLGRADPYEMHISWDETTVVHLDANGNPVSINNL
jgi:WXG100 family type VII secretion target